LANPETPANVADLATQSGVTTTSGLILLGIYSPEDSLNALVRLPSGRVRNVKRGAMLDGGRVAGINEIGVVLQKNGRSKRLRPIK